MPIFIEDEPFFQTKGKEFSPVSGKTIEAFASLFNGGPLHSHELYLHQTAVGLRGWYPVQIN